MIVEIKKTREGFFYDEQHCIGQRLNVWENPAIPGIYYLHCAVAFLQAPGLVVMKEDCEVISG